MQTKHDPSRKEPEGEWLNAGEYLKRELARQGITVQALAAKIGLTPSSIYNVIGSTQRPISAGLARKLNEMLGGTVEFWLGDRFPNRAIPPDAAKHPAAAVPGILTDRRLVELNTGEEDGFFVSPLDDEQYQGASIDLRMGSFITSGFELIKKVERNSLFWMHQADLDESRLMPDLRDHVAELRARKIVCAAEYTVPVGGHAFVVAAQFIRMGLHFVGLLGQTTEGNLRGMIVHCGHQIDPGFTGPLIFRVKNDSGEPMPLTRGDPLAAITIVALAGPVERRYGKNPTSQIGGVLDALRAVLAEHILMSNHGAGWQMTFGDEVIDGVTRESVIAAFFTWLDLQVKANNPGVHAILADTLIDSEGITSLGGFLGCKSETIDEALTLAEASPKMQCFGKAISNLTASVGHGNEAIRKVLSELRILATGMVGFDITKRSV